MLREFSVLLQRFTRDAVKMVENREMIVDNGCEKGNKVRFFGR